MRCVGRVLSARAMSRPPTRSVASGRGRRRSSAWRLAGRCDLSDLASGTNFAIHELHSLTYASYTGKSRIFRVRYTYRLICTITTCLVIRSEKMPGRHGGGPMGGGMGGGFRGGMGGMPGGGFGGPGWGGGWGGGWRPRGPWYGGGYYRRPFWGGWGGFLPLFFWARDGRGRCGRLGGRGARVLVPPAPFAPIFTPA